MKSVSLGDLAQNLLLNRQNVQLKQDINRLTTELATGRVQDVSDRLNGNFSVLADFERDLTLLDAFAATATEAANQAEVMQISLDAIRESTTSLTETLGLSFTTVGSNGTETVGQEARAQLTSVISKLNASTGGRSLFSGTEVKTAPLPDLQTILTDLQTAMVGATTAADVLAAADAFFGPSGAFETVIYQGGTTDLDGFDLGNGESVALNLRADNESFRDVLKSLSVAALIDDPALVLAPGETQELIQSLIETTVESGDRVTTLQASLGFSQERIEAASVRISSERSTIDIARNELVSADAFQTATELEAVQIQLETLYTVTARSSRLSLVNFLS